MNRLIAIPITFILSFSAYAKDFYIDPSKGFMLNPGTAEMPWKTLQEVVSNNLIQTKNKDGVIVNPNAPVKAGDTLKLRTGYHGNVYIRSAYNDSIINVVADDGNLPVLSSLRIDSARNWLFNGLTISGSFASPKITGGSIVLLGSSNYFGSLDSVQIMNCAIFTDEGMEASWTSSDWNTKSSNGVSIYPSASNIVIRNNYIYNVSFGVMAGATNSVTEGNVISMFANDGIRVTGNNSTVRDNVITNNIQAGNGNHDDGIQGFFMPPTVNLSGVNISGNIILNRENRNTIPESLQEPLQGIGFFDGPYSDLQIQNNLVKVDNWQGMGLFDGTSSSIQNNYLIGSDPKIKTRMTLSSKSKIPKNIFISISNNIAPDYLFEKYDETNTSLINNLTSVDTNTFDTMLTNGISRINSIYGIIPKRKYRLIFSSFQN